MTSRPPTHMLFSPPKEWPSPRAGAAPLANRLLSAEAQEGCLLPGAFGQVGEDRCHRPALPSADLGPGDKELTAWPLVGSRLVASALSELKPKRCHRLHLTDEKTEAARSHGLFAVIHVMQGGNESSDRLSDGHQVTQQAKGERTLETRSADSPGPAALSE